MATPVTPPAIPPPQGTPNKYGRRSGQAQETSDSQVSKDPSSLLNQTSARAPSGAPMLGAEQQQQPISSMDIRTSFSPLPLTAGQEAQVKEIYHRNVRARCQPEIRQFAECSVGRTITIPIVCRQQRLKMNECMLKFATRDEEDRAREEWFQTIGQRAKEKDELEQWKAKEKEKWREWWGLDEQGRRIRK